MIDNEYEESVIGTPQGGNLSPLLANIMLNELDKEMEQKGLKYLGFGFYFDTHAKYQRVDKLFPNRQYEDDMYETR